MRIRIYLVAMCLTGLICSGPVVAQKMISQTSGERAIKLEEIRWVDASPKFIKGAKIAVLLGDPSKPGMFIMRFKLPANYKIAPHTHPADEHVTVLQGGLALGIGTKMDATIPVMPAGGFLFTPANKPHFCFTQAETITEVSGMGPFEIVYLDPADDPSKSTRPGTPAKK